MQFVCTNNVIAFWVYLNLKAVSELVYKARKHTSNVCYESIFFLKNYHLLDIDPFIISMSVKYEFA